jgi:hypothetical protein
VQGTSLAAGEKRERAAAALTEGSLAGFSARWRAGAGGSGPCRVSGGVGVIVRGAGLVKLRGVASSSSSRGFCSSFSPLSSPGVAMAEGKKGTGG